MIRSTSSLASGYHKSPPQKWLKYDLLDLYGLADSAYLRSTIDRFEKNLAAEFLKKLTLEVKSATSAHENTNSTLFVVKFVPRFLSILLPNIRVQTLADIDSVRKAIHDNKMGDYEEIWFCRTNISAGSLSVAGRIIVDATGTKKAHLIEQVWRCSPRLIESLGPSFRYPYIYATRPGWGWSPKVELIHIPPGAADTISTLRIDFSTSMRLLNAMREKLDVFSEAVLATGVGLCSLEYKIEKGFVQIIDWDTPNDYRVIQELIFNEKA